MFAAIYDVHVTVIACWLVTFVAATGVVVLPWSRGELLAVHEAWATLASLVARMGRRTASVAAEGALVVETRDELPDLTWELTGDWTTVTG